MAPNRDDAVEVVDGELLDVDTRARQVSELTSRFSDDDMRAISSFDEALSFVEAEYGTIHEIADYIGNGFTVLPSERKTDLIGKELIVIDWRVNDGDYGLYASLAVVTREGNAKWIVNDGSSGIGAQLKQLTAEKGITGGLRVPGGLRVSEYDTCAECDRPRSPSEDACTHCGDALNRPRHKGKTYYLDTAARQN